MTKRAPRSFLIREGLAANLSPDGLTLFDSILSWVVQQLSLLVLPEAVKK